MSFVKNDIIDYYEERRVHCGLVLEPEPSRLRVLTEQGRESKISPARVVNSVHLADFPWFASRDEQVRRIKEISATREQIKARIDLRELWEVVGTETNEVGIDELSELYFGKDLDFNSAAALLRAISEDRVYFRLTATKIEVISAEKVEQTLTQREKERKHVEFVAECADFLARLKRKEEVSVEQAPHGLVAVLEEAALFGKDWTTLKTAKEIFSLAGVEQQLDPFSVLVRLGVWSEDENIRLRAEKVPLEFDAETEAAARLAAEKPPPAKAKDLTQLRPVAVDSPSTRDVDDAISLSHEGDEIVVGIHIADVAHYVEHDSLLDKAIRHRGTSIYLPDRIIPMIPLVLSEDAASLTAGEHRPTLSVLVRLAPDLQVRDFTIVPSIVRVDERVSYEEADERIGSPETLEAQLFAVASVLRQRRVERGAIILKDPELSVRVNDDGEIEVSARDRETPSQIMVSEIMILANSLFADFLTKHNVPGIFRSQPPPNERLCLSEEYDPVLSYRCRKSMVRGEVGPEPAPHHTLGLDSYTTATSPLRRYADLLIQRQVKSYLETGFPLLTREHLDQIMMEISYPLDRAVLLERDRQRYFLLKFLAAHKKETFEAVVLHRFPRFHLVQIVEYGFNAALNTPDGLLLNPYDRALVRLEKVNAREDQLSFSLAKQL
jgi:exoribonuclease-2